jgi:isocitrate dehydrogenase (NAD+)
MMLDHVGKQDLANRLRTAITDTLNIDSVRTRDLKGEATTKQFTDAVCKRLSSR